MSSHIAVLLLGSNLGDTKKNIEQAVIHLKKDVGELIQTSDFHHTRPVEFASLNFFCNFALSIKTHFSPLLLLKAVKQIEKQMGRVRDSVDLGGYNDRIIDIDIVMYDNISYYCSQLELPHRKHLYERDFSKELLKDLGIITEKHKL